ncbi:MAG TPA: helix-turn-helix domain-containing protein [Blastocatellia bacterium]|nr:helix-turn-helix domain-containing protein [Blastocatellia bacterium]
MSKASKPELSRYVERVMKDKHLSRRDVSLRSGGDITDSYVSAILSGGAKNLSIDKLKALARGLRVREMSLIRAAFGFSEEPDDRRSTDQSHNLLLLDITRKTLISYDVAEIVQEVVKLTPAERAVVLQYVRRIGRAERKLHRKRKSV